MGDGDCNEQVDTRSVNDTVALSTVISTQQFGSGGFAQPSPTRLHNIAVLRRPRLSATGHAIFVPETLQVRRLTLLIFED